MAALPTGLGDAGRVTTPEGPEGPGGPDEAGGPDGPDGPGSPTAPDGWPEARLRRIVVTVRGRVQGVGFRWFAQRQAERLGLAGWVSNQPDGSVKVVAEGEARSLDRFVAALRSGPPAASVREAEVRHEPPRGLGPGFDLRPGAHRGD